MDLGLVIALSFCFFVFFATSITVFITRGRKKQQNRGRVLNAPVVVTSATHTAPGGYPVTQLPPPGGYQTNVYATSYPTHTVPATMQMPMPMPMPMQMQGAQPPPAGMPAHMAPYPPAPAENMNPPSYDMAVGGGPAMASYEKQSPYNPSYQAQ